MAPLLYIYALEKFDPHSLYLKATVYVQLVNQEVKTHLHHVRYFSFSFSEMNNQGTVDESCSDLLFDPGTDFIKEDKLLLQILSMELNGNKNLPYTFSLCAHSDYLGLKPQHREWTSSPFYSNTGGFKFLMKVYPAGIENGKDSYLSFLIIADSANPKPFVGSVTVFFVQNRGSKLHYTVQFDGQQKSLYSMLFLEMQEIEGNTRFMTQSDVQDNLVSYDCIILGISDIQVKITSLL